MKWLFWLSLMAVGYTYVAYPIWLWMRSRWRPRPWKQAGIFPTVSVIVAAHNEAERIQAKLLNLLSLDYPAERLEIIVVSDGSTDGTDGILEKLASSRLHALRYTERRGKAAALNLAMEQAGGEIVVFTDTRQELERAAVARLVSNFADPGVGCVTGELVLRKESGPAETDGIGMYWRYEKWIRKCEALCDSSVGATGAIYAVRRELLTALPHGTILDDVYLPFQAIRRGFRCVFDSQARAWDSLPASQREEFRRKVRTLTGNYQLLQLAPWLIRRENRVRFEFLSHKLLRLLMPLFLAATFFSCWWLAAEPVYLGLALLQSALYASAVLGLVFSFRPFQAPAAFCLLNWAAVIGFVNFLFHREALWQVWLPTSFGRSVAGRKSD